LKQQEHLENSSKDTSKEQKYNLKDLDLTSIILSTIYKIPFYILSMVVAAILMMIISETSITLTIGASKAYGIVIIAYGIFVLIYYDICRSIRLKNSTLSYSKVSRKSKIKFIVIMMLLLIVTSIITPLIMVLLKTKIQ
jgi:membrane associated rhomboid family serine protease